MSYSIDLRTRVLSYVESGGSRLSASRVFKVSERTVRNWINLHRETGSVLCCHHGGGFVSKVDPIKFKQYIADNPDKTLQEIGDHFGVTHEGAAYNLRKHGYVYKKNTSLPEAQRRKNAKISG
jgi:transposase